MKPRSLISVLIVVIILTGSGSASGNGNDQRSAKSPTVAFNSSLIATVAPVLVGVALVAANDNPTPGLVIGGAGILLGPGYGHAYAANSSQFAAGFTFRLLGAGIAVAGFGTYEIFRNADNTVPTLLAVGGSFICLASAVHDIITADDAAEKYNRRHGLAGISIQPAYFAQHKAYGLSISISL